jgi:hypothetical protein
MPRARFVAIAAVPLLAVLLTAQPGVAQFNIFQPLIPQPVQPAPPAPQQKTAPAATPAKPAPAKPAPAAAQNTTPIPKPKPSVLKTPEPKKVEAKKPDAKKLDAKKPEQPKYALTDYFRVWGVSGTTTRADIVARFGEPQRVGDWASKPFYYFNGTLTFFFTSDDTVSTMIVGNSSEAIPPNSIPPDVVEQAFIGRKRDDVLKAFGPANMVSSENYRYFPKTGVYKVEFQCYDFKGHICGQMLVQF